MGLFLGIVAVIAIGALIAYAVVLTIRWLKDKIKSLLAKRNVKKVAAMDLERLIDECPNQKTLDDLFDDGYDKVIATVNDSGKVEDVEVVKNTGDEDWEVEELLGSERMVVIK